MNAIRKRTLKLRSLRREVRKAKMAFWIAEEKFEQLFVKFFTTSIRDKKFFKVMNQKNAAERHYKQCELELKEAQSELEYALNPKRKGRKS